MVQFLWHARMMILDDPAQDDFVTVAKLVSDTLDIHAGC
jgi:hypothetical protein